MNNKETAFQLEPIKIEFTNGAIARPLSQEYSNLAQIIEKKEIIERELLKEIKAIELSYQKFLPLHLLELLDQTSIQGINPGNQIEKMVTVLFLRIHNYDDLFHDMSARENFNFLNSLYAQLDPILIHFKGVVDQFEGDTLRILFFGDVDDAILCATTMLGRITAYNSGRRRALYPEVKIGVGIDTGLLMVGAVGNNNHMHSITLGKHLEQALKIEELTSVFGVELIVSQNVMSGIVNRTAFYSRLLGRTRAANHSESIYEVFNQRGEEEIIKIMQGREKFETALALFYLGRKEESLLLFLEGVKKYAGDAPAQLYIDLCSNRKDYCQTFGYDYENKLNTSIEWHNSLSFKNEKFDLIFKENCSNLELCVERLNNGIDGSVPDLLASLRDYAESFKIELTLMKEQGYPFIIEHQKEHERFLSNLVQIERETEGDIENEIGFALKIQKLLLDGFTTHISNSDRHLALFLNK